MFNGRAGLYYISIENQIDQADLTRILGVINTEKRLQIERKHHKVDRTRSLLGLQLIEQAALDIGVANFELKHMVFPENAKPYYAKEQSLDFNISHSGNHVVGIVSLDKKVGVDVEVFREMDASKFARYFNHRELQYAEVSQAHFFQVWTAKEAVAKGVGKGLSIIDRVEIEANNASATYDDQFWQLEWHMLADGIICVATQKA